MKNPGFTVEERKSFEARLLGPAAAGGCALLDSFRLKYSKATIGYTYFGERVSVVF